MTDQPHHTAERPCLAIETSNPSLNAEVGVGLLASSGARILAIEPLRAVGRNEDDLLPAIERACAAAGISPRQLRAVSVSIGPGGYTSLRVACAAGKMIAEVTGAACIGVPTALAIAHTHRSASMSARVGVLLAGKDQSAFLTVFPPGGWRAGSPVPGGRLVSTADFPHEEVDVVVGDQYVPAPIREALAERGIPIVKPELRAAACIELAPHLPLINPVELVPLYPREPDAVRLWRERANR